MKNGELLKLNRCVLYFLASDILEERANESLTVLENIAPLSSITNVLETNFTTSDPDKDFF